MRTASRRSHPRSEDRGATCERPDDRDAEAPPPTCRGTGQPSIAGVTGGRAPRSSPTVAGSPGTHQGVARVDRPLADGAALRPGCPGCPLHPSPVPPAPRPLHRLASTARRGSEVRVGSAASRRTADRADEHRGRSPRVAPNALRGSHGKSHASRSRCGLPLHSLSRALPSGAVTLRSFSLAHSRAASPRPLPSRRPWYSHPAPLLSPAAPPVRGTPRPQGLAPWTSPLLPHRVSGGEARCSLGLHFLAALRLGPAPIPARQRMPGEGEGPGLFAEGSRRQRADRVGSVGLSDASSPVPCGAIAGPVPTLGSRESGHLRDHGLGIRLPIGVLGPGPDPRELRRSGPGCVVTTALLCGSCRSLSHGKFTSQVGRPARGAAAQGCR